MWLISSQPLLKIKRSLLYGEKIIFFLKQDQKNDAFIPRYSLTWKLKNDFPFFVCHGIDLAETSSSSRCLRQPSFGAEWNVMTRSAKMRRGNEALCCHAWRLSTTSTWRDSCFANDSRSIVTPLKFRNFSCCDEMSKGAFTNGRTGNSNQQYRTQQIWHNAIKSDRLVKNYSFY